MSRVDVTVQVFARLLLPDAIRLESGRQVERGYKRQSMFGSALAGLNEAGRFIACTGTWLTPGCKTARNHHIM